MDALQQTTDNPSMKQIYKTKILNDIIKHAKDLFTEETQNNTKQSEDIGEHNTIPTDDGGTVMAKNNNEKKLNIKI